MRLKLVNKVSWTFDEPVGSCHGEARMTPCWTSNQGLLSPQVTIEPAAWRHDYFDYWGTAVVAFSISEPHPHLSVTASTELQFSAPAQVRGAGLGWDDLTAPELIDRHSEYLQVTTDDDEAPDAWHELRARTSGPAEFVRQIRPAGLVDGHGDAMVHDVLAVARWAGVPARFVSGYLIPRQLIVDEPQVAAPHAWVQFWDGAWRSWDPGLGAAPDQRHVVVGFGRTRADLPLLTGVHNGGQQARAQCETTVTRLV